MSRWIRNPITAIPFLLLILWLSLRVVKIMLGFSWLLLLLIIVFLLINRHFRNIVRDFFNDLFKGF